MAKLNVYGSGKLFEKKKDPLANNPLIATPREIKLPDSSKYDDVLNDVPNGFLRAQLLEKHIGIIPTGGVDMGQAYASLPWDFVYTPVASDLLAIERSVLECVYANCSSIWIVATETVGTLIRERLGEHCMIHHNADDKKKDDVIPIYYIPYHSHDAILRPFTSWAILYAYWFVTRLMYNVSSAMIPIGAYVSFPTSVYDPKVGLTLSKIIREQVRDGNVEYPSIAIGGRGPWSNDPIGFFIDERCWYMAAAVYSDNPMLSLKYAKFYDMPKWREAAVEHCSAHFSLDKVFEDMVASDVSVELPWQYDIRTWEGYREFLGSEHNLENEIYDKIAGRRFLEYEVANEMEEDDGD